MAPSKGKQEKISEACKAMNRYGISAETVRSALKRILEVYENNWMLIEDDDYKLLLDFISEPDGPKKMEIVKHDSKLVDDHAEEEEEETRPLKRKPRMRNEVSSSTMSAAEISDDYGPASAGCEHGEELLFSEYNIDNKAHTNEDENVNVNVNEDVPPSPYSPGIVIASSSNGEVKLVTRSHLSMKHVEDIYSHKFEAPGTEFSLSQLLKDVCECFMEQGKTSVDHVGNKIPSFDNFKEPEKQDGPANDPNQTSRFMVSSEFDYCSSGRLRRKPMVGIEELSSSSSLTIIPKEQLTVDFCMGQENASDHVGNKLPSFDNFKEPEKQGAPTSDLIVVSHELDHCYSRKTLRTQEDSK